MPNVLTKEGSFLNLGSEIGRGGEGSVHEISGRPDLVAKIYHKPLTPEKASKIAAMVAAKSDRLINIAAWPVDVLYDRTSSHVLGLLMPKIIGLSEIHTLYGPKSRLTHFPNATWPFLIHTAMNAARAFSVIHDHGHVVGDVNQSNLMVSDRATVKLIDCDSFQLNHNGRSYLCEVGVPTHTPPELQSKSFKGIMRTANHDNFGLAVVIFQLLFMGRHPFSGQYLGPGDMSIEKSIAEFRFAYGSTASIRQMKPPPGTLPLESASATLASMFERAFSPNGVMPNARPTAQEWVQSLTNLEKNTKSCLRNSGHQFLSTLSQCPWCEVERKSGIILFNVVITGSANSGNAFDIHDIWIKITSVTPPGPLPTIAIPSIRSTPSTQIQQIVRERRALRRISYGIAVIIGLACLYFASPIITVAVLIIAIGIAGSVANSPYTQVRRKTESDLKAAQSLFQNTKLRYERECSDYDFKNCLYDLERKKLQWHDLPKQRQQKMSRLEQDLYKRQQERYLDRFKLYSARVDGIGPGRLATLQSYGIETAGDIEEHKIMAIPGFGPSLTSSLLVWRHSCEQRFVFNPAIGVDPADVAAINQEFDQLRVKLEQELSQGPQTLNQIVEQIKYKRITLRPGLEASARTMASLQTDLSFIK